MMPVTRSGRALVLQGENRPPRPAVDESLVDCERASQGVELLDQARNVHEGRVGELVRLPAPSWS